MLAASRPPPPAVEIPRSRLLILSISSRASASCANDDGASVQGARFGGVVRADGCSEEAALPPNEALLRGLSDFRGRRCRTKADLFG